MKTWDYRKALKTLNVNLVPFDVRAGFDSRGVATEDGIMINPFITKDEINPVMMHELGHMVLRHPFERNEMNHELGEAEAYAVAALILEETKDNPKEHTYMMQRMYEELSYSGHKWFSSKSINLIKNAAEVVYNAGLVNT